MYNRMNKGKQTHWSMRAIAFVFVIIFLMGISIPASANGKEENKETVYLNGIEGDDLNDGSVGLPVKTFQKAKSILKGGGTILVTGSLDVYGEQVWSLSSGGAIKAADGLMGAFINVHVGSELTLQDIIVIGNGQTVIANSGTVYLPREEAIQSVNGFVGKSGIRLEDGGRVVTKNEEVSKAEKKNNTLRIFCEDVYYGEKITPKVIENESNGQVSFFYKEKDANDSTYQTAVPGEAGSYVVKAVSSETKEYNSAWSTAGFTITRALAGDVVFPYPYGAVENKALSEAELIDGCGDGRFYWADGSLKVQEGRSYEVIFEPTDTKNYDYSEIEGWNVEESVVVRKVRIEKTEKISETDKIEETKESSGGQLNEKTVLESASEKTADSELEGQLSEDVQDSRKNDKSGNEDEVSEKHISESSSSSQPSAVEAEILGLPENIQSLGDVTKAVKTYQKYEALSNAEKLLVSVKAQEYLKLVISNTQHFNHESNGVTVTGDTLTWNIQLRANRISKSDNAHKAEFDELIFPYEIKLWDVLTNQEYFLPAGQQVQIEMPAPDLKKYENIVVVHYKADNSIEYIKPYVENEKLVFMTSSFSPFDIVGSLVLVPSGSEESDTNKGTDEIKSSENSNEQNKTESKTNTGKIIPSTGDERMQTAIIFGTIALAALLIGIIMLVIKKRRK